MGMQFYIWLHDRMIEKKISQVELAKQIGCSKKTVSRWLKNEYMPTIQQLKKLILVLEISDQEAFIAAGLIHQEIHELPDSEVMIPVLPGKIPCGVPGFDFEPYVIGHEAFNRTLLQSRIKNYSPESTRLYIVHAKGDSMTGKGIVENDLVVFSPDITVQSGDVAIVEVEEGICIKQVVFQSDAVILKSANPQYEPIVIINKPVHILGKVIMHVGYL